MVIVLVRYVKPLEDIEKHLVAHRAFLDQHYKSGLLIASGPRVPRNGGVLLTRQIAKEKLLQILKEDPFQKAGVAEYELLEFTPVKSAPGFAEFLAEFE